MAKNKEEDTLEKKDDQKKEEEQQKEERETVSKDEYQALNDKYLRLFAEFENYKKRTIKERMELVRNAAQETIVDLLPVLDDFDRAKKNAEDEATEEHFSEGVELVYNKLYKVLRQKGLKEMETNEKEFDAELHEAVSEIPAPSEKMKGKIIDTVEKGYYLNDKIIRHAKVVVGK
jgi:molecular chaperone GrpE